MQGARRPASKPKGVLKGNSSPRLDQVVRGRFSLSWGDARRAIATGKIFVGGERVTDPSFGCREDAEIVFRANAPNPGKRPALAPEAIVYLDAQVVVVNKPPGLSTVPYDETETLTLDGLVRDLLAKKSKGGARAALGVVHRIDKETSGLLVFTRTWAAKEHLASQFRLHTTERSYLAIAHGAVERVTLRSHLVNDRGDGLRGSSERAPKHRRVGEGRLSVTHVEPLEHLRGATLIRCTLETGRTHQIRIHLSEAGHPLVGEPVYKRDYSGELLPAPRLMLHATTLGFVHPTLDRMLSFEQGPPADFMGVWEGLR